MLRNLAASLAIRLSAAGIAFLLFSAFIHAQTSSTGAIVGRVTDPSGAAVPQATVNLLRQAQELTFLQPGTTPANGSDSGGSVAGAVNDQTTFTLDGIDITDNSTNSTVDSDHGARPVLLVSVEAIDEFRVAE